MRRKPGYQLPPADLTGDFKPETVTATVSGPGATDRRGRRWLRRSRPTHSGSPATDTRSVLSFGAAMLYLSLIVLIPLAAVVAKGFSSGLSTFWQSVTTTMALKAFGVTLLFSLITALVSAVMGTLIAWVLVRDKFRGQKLLNTLIDLPFALPSIVAGFTLIALYGPDSPIGVNIAYTRGVVLIALLWVTLPFGVRSAQPVLMELDIEAEQAAASLGAGGPTIFRRIILPALAPSIVSGAALSFARSIGEFGSLALIAGKVPIASIVIYADIESGDTQSAAAMSVVLMVISLLVLFLIRRLGGRTSA